MTTEFITEFMDALVQKHGYDKEVMQSTWQSVTAVPRKRILPPSLRPSKAAAVVAEKPKKEKVLCSYIFEEGKKKDQICGVWVRNPNEISCAKHTTSRLEEEKFTKLFNNLVDAIDEIKDDNLVYANGVHAVDEIKKNGVHVPSYHTNLTELAIAYKEDTGPFVQYKSKSDDVLIYKFKPKMVAFLKTVTNEEFTKFIAERAERADHLFVYQVNITEKEHVDGGCVYKLDLANTYYRQRRQR